VSLRPACRPAWSRARGSGPTTGRKEFQTGKAHTGWSNGDDRISSSSPRRFPRFMCAEYNYLNKRRAVVLDSYLCLASVKGKFFQARMDTTKDARTAEDKRHFLQSWIAAWIPVLWPSH
jgi:hypothetical protein